MDMIDDALSDALALPAGKYLTPQTPKLNPDQAVLISEGEQQAKTNSTSTLPVIGAEGLAGNSAIIAYNRKTRTACITRQDFPTGPKLMEAVRQVRSNPSDHVDVHIIGAPYYEQAIEHVSADELTAASLHSVTVALRGMEMMSNVTLKTCDVYNKPKPHAVAIDARNGKLIRGSELFKTQERAEYDVLHGDSQFEAIKPLDEGVNFDGTAPEFQKPRGRNLG